MQNLYKVHKESNFESGSPDTLKLDKKTFKEVISPNIVLITRAFRSQFVIPDFQDFIKDIEEMYWSAKSITDGKVASYIPQLARATPDSWGVSICTIDGQRFSIGKQIIFIAFANVSIPYHELVKIPCESYHEQANILNGVSVAESKTSGIN